MRQISSFTQYFLVTLSWVFSLSLYLPVTIFHSVVALGIFKGFGLFKRKCIDPVFTDERVSRA